MDAGFADMELIAARRENMPLLHFCIARGILTEAILNHLKSQQCLAWTGYTPLLYGRIELNARGMKLF